jgi:ABC-type uncharacterized transport system permease subunit
VSRVVVMTATDLSIILISTVVLTTPVLLAALGGLLSERVGVFALALEPFMLVGAFIAVIAARETNAYIGLIAGGLGGLIVAWAYAVFTVRLSINQVAAAIGILTLSIGAVSFFNNVLLERSGTTFQGAPQLPQLEIPILVDIPLLGQALFNQNVLVYFSYAALLFVVYYLTKSHSGLRLSSVGDAPRVAETRGIPVAKTRTVAVLASGLLAGLGGAMLSIGILGAFTPNIVGGRGFIALAAIIFAGWRPLWVVFAALLFGAADALQLWMTAEGFDISPAILNMLPYLLTLGMLLVMANRTPPASLGMPYYRELRG